MIGMVAVVAAVVFMAVFGLAGAVCVVWVETFHPEDNPERTSACSST